MKPPGLYNPDITLGEDLRRRILVLDGATGTEARRLLLKENGSADKVGKGECTGVCDFLCLTRPDVIEQIHLDYIEAGADIITTNTFNANAVSLRGLADASAVRDLNLAGARLARQAADSAMHSQARRVYVAGSMGPSAVLLSRAAERTADFAALEQAYALQAEALLNGRVDTLLLETIVDLLSAKAAIAGIHRAFSLAGRRVPLMLCASPCESGLLLSGEPLEKFAALAQEAGAFSIGLNCGFGTKHLSILLDRLQSARCHVTLHPNAGMPDAEGCYPQSPQAMAADLAIPMRQGKLNIAGGCCGTTPQHIRAIATAAKGCDPRRTMRQQAR